MSGGIARFAHKPAATAAATAAVAQEEHKESAEEFSGGGGDGDDGSFGGFGEFDRHRDDTNINDDFGFMGGGGGDSTGGGFDFGGDGGFHDDEDLEEDTATVMEDQGHVAEQASPPPPTPDKPTPGNGGISLFTNRTVTSAKAPLKPNDDLQTPSPCHHKPAARNATVTPASAWNGAGGTGAVTVARFSTPANDPSRNFPNHHHDHSAAIPTAVHTTPNVIITQTPDGRVLPVGSVPQVTTSPRGLFSRGGTGNGVSLNQGYPHATTASHASLTGPLLANRNTATPTAPAYGFANRTTPDREEMGPPPPRCPVVVTPAAAAATATTQPLQGTATTAVKPCEGPPDDGRVVSPGTQEQQKQTKDNPFHGADTRSKLPDAEENATGMFHEVHQQFVRTLRDFSDTESNYYKALLLDKMVEIDKATSIVLQVRVDVLDSIDQAEALQRKFAQAFRDVENDN